jgi:hypothetical protein
MIICKIDGVSYDVLITAISENFNILYSENTGRTMSKGARMTLDPLGTFVGHNVTFQRKRGYEEEFDKLFNYLMQPRIEGIHVELVHNQTILSYDAYVSTGERKLERIDPNTGKILWGSFSANIVPMEAQIVV